MTEDSVTEGCMACSGWAKPGDLPPRESITRSDHWRVAHAFNSSLPGWLVALPRRHVTALDQLSEPEIKELGPLLRSLTAALRRVTGCQKTYVLLLAEQDGFAHVHFHVVPRMPDLPDEHRGPAIFHYLKEPADRQLTEAQRDEVALSLRSALAGSR